MFSDPRKEFREGLSLSKEWFFSVPFDSAFALGAVAIAEGHCHTRFTSAGFLSELQVGEKLQVAIEHPPNFKKLACTTSKRAALGLGMNLVSEGGLASVISTTKVHWVFDGIQYDKLPDQLFRDIKFDHSHLIAKAAREASRHGHRHGKVDTGDKGPTELWVVTEVMKTTTITGKTSNGDSFDISLKVKGVGGGTDASDSGGLVLEAAADEPVPIAYRLRHFTFQ